MPQPAPSGSSVVKGAFGMGLRVVALRGLAAGPCVGVKVIGPRGGIHGVTWIDNPDDLDDLINDLERALLDADAGTGISPTEAREAIS